jgi:hypothetical protein
MTTNSSATPREETSNNTTTSPNVIDASIKRRARLLVTNASIPKATRHLINYALQIKDPKLVQVVRRVEAGEMEIHRLRPE